MDNITFLVNGTFKNKAKVIENIRKVFSQNDIEIVESQHKEHLTELAYRTVTKGITKLVVVGGDGSTNEVVNGIAKYAKDTTLNTYNWEKIEGIKLGILPCGTGNDFTKTIHITNDMDRLKTLLDLDQYQKCDIGSVDFLDKNQKPAQRFFMNITDVGMGGIVVEKLEKKMPFFSRSFRYNLSISSTFLSYDKALVRAESKDGKFNIVILGNINFIDYMKNLNEVKKCKLIHHEEVKYFTTDELQVNSPNHTSLPIDMDGEFIGYAPLQARNISKVINIYM
jgi:diacylglycerol kinase family enzyme